MVSTLEGPEPAEWLLGWAGASPEALEPRLFTRIMKNLPPERDQEVISVARRAAGDDFSRELDLLAALREGAVQRGSGRSASLDRWARDAAGRLRQRLDEGGGGWTLSGTSGASPFGIDRRVCADGVEAEVVTSLPPPRGGALERLTGTLSSPVFECPPTLEFWILGHRGRPGEPVHEKSFVRLVDADGGKELARAYPPQDDAGQPVRWELGPTTGRPVRLEITDGDSGEAFAWLAVGRLSPPVVNLGLPQVDAQWRALGEIARELRMTELGLKLAEGFCQPELSDATRGALARALAELLPEREVLAEVFRTVPSRFQNLLAEALAGTPAGARLALELVPAPVLTAANVSGKIEALNDPDLRRRLTEVTAGLPGASAEAAAAIEARMETWRQAQASGTAEPARGEALFALHCALCHQLAGRGQLVGPQLDGVGTRGVERLCEDILDPNRAVDPMFRLRLARMKDGSVVSGVLRREEPQTLVLADATGREITLARSELEGLEESPLSLMPPTFGQSMTPAEFADLLAYLLEQREGGGH